MKIKNILLITIPAAIFVAGFLLFSAEHKFFANEEKLVIEKSEEFASTEMNVLPDGDKISEDAGVVVENIDNVNTPVASAENENVKSDAMSLVTEEKKEELVKEEKETVDIKIIKNLVSWGFEKKSSRNIDTVIIHSSYDALGDKPYNVRGLIDEYKQYGVAPHYLIDREGSVYQLVADSNVAYHAGQSKVPDGRSNVNDFSLGIELMNTKEDEYTAEQYVALGSLLDYLKGEYKIKYVLGHSQISPGRKDDPWNFDWSKI